MQTEVRFIYCLGGEAQQHYDGWGGASRGRRGHAEAAHKTYFDAELRLESEGNLWRSGVVVSVMCGWLTKRSRFRLKGGSEEN